MMDEQSRTLRGKILGALLRDARLDAGKSMKSLGEMIGSSSSTISSFEHGRKSFSLPELELLAYHLDVPLQHFFDPTTESLADEPTFEPSIMIELRDRMIGAMLRQRRHELGYSIREVADRTDMPPSRISAYERGLRSIPLPDLESLLIELEDSLDRYIDQDGPIGAWHRNQEAFEQFKELPEELRSFFSDPDHRTYLRMARELSRLDVNDLQSIAETLQDILD
ncbi:MAG: helix-turn-helix transcriptional regulator [Anaerolineales bacterium]|nr:helix-turn-helix transcriptional regulator [Anaerolineales bacterium]